MLASGIAVRGVATVAFHGVAEMCGGAHQRPTVSYQGTVCTTATVVVRHSEQDSETLRTLGHVEVIPNLSVSSRRPRSSKIALAAGSTLTPQGCSYRLWE